MADAVEAHDDAIAATGGLHGILSIDSVLSAIARPYSGYHRSIARKGAALLESVVGNHGFADGNKRTAVVLLHLLLARSGYQLPQSELVSVELEELVVGLANRSRDFESAHNWLKTRCQRIGPEA